MNAKGGKNIRGPDPTGQIFHDPTWQWLTAVWEQANGDWLSQEIFDIMKQASLHGDIENLVCCQATILATLNPAGVPTPESWLWSWRLAHNAASGHRRLYHPRQVREAPAAFS